MKRPDFNEMTWLAFDWQRPFEPEAVTDLLTHLASHAPQTPLVFEARGAGGRVRYYLGAERQFARIITGVMKAHGDIRFAVEPPNSRVPVNSSCQLKITQHRLALNTERMNAVTRAGLAALMQPKNGEQSVIQIILGAPYNPSPMPNTVHDPHASWAQKMFGNVGPATTEAKNAVKEKIGINGFNAVIRLGATGTRQTGRGHILSLLSALRTLQSAGVFIQMTAEKTEKLNFAYIPWHFPLRLSVKEIANFMLLPSGETELPGVAGLHPKQIMPPNWYQNPFPVHDRTFAMSLNKRKKLSISPKDSLEHTVVIGPTGAGKSTVLQKMILSDIYAGKSILVVDPKADLINGIIARIPKHREDDLVVIDPSAENAVVGFNPLSFEGHDPNLLADSVLNTMQNLFADNWGIRSQEHISAGLLTLAKVKGASLLWLPLLFTDKAFRAKITAGINDPIGLGPYWKSFEELRDSEKRQEIAPVLNKVRQLLLRPNLRNILGQSNPKFSMTELFTKPRIVLIPCNKGLIGGDSSRFLGSLVTGVVWNIALARAGIPEERRTPVSFYLDEFQDFVSSVASDFSSALAQARGLGVGLTMAHQYREQLSPELRAGVDANARNKIVFGLNATDAKAMAAMAPELTPEDFMTLPRYSIYTSFNNGGRNTGWVSGMTLPMTRQTCNPDEIRAKVAARYGKPGAEVEQEYLALLARCHTDDKPETETGPVGRRKKT